MSDTDTRELILTIASTLYASRGYEAVSMRDVAAEVRIKPASLYYHFRDKEELIRDSLAYVFAEKTAPIEALLQGEASPRERLNLFIDWFVRLIFADPTFSRLLTRELLDGNAERLEHLTKTVFDRPFSLIARTIAEAGGKEEPALSALSLVAMILGHYQLSGALPHLSQATTDYADPDRLVDHFTRLLDRALGPLAGEAGR